MDGAFGYNLESVRTRIAQWDASLSDTDLDICDAGGLLYRKALAELEEALYSAGYTVTSAEPIAYQRCHDILTTGVALYYIEGHTGVAYQDGYSPTASAFGRYRATLKDIAAGGQLGELSHKAKAAAVSCHIARQWR